MRKSQSGSRMVGGKKPNNPDIYKSFESEEYVIPDTAQQEATFMNDTKYKTKRRYYCLWALYFSIGVSVSLCKCFANFFWCVDNSVGAVGDRRKRICTRWWARACCGIFWGGVQRIFFLVVSKIKQQSVSTIIKLSHSLFLFFSFSFHSVQPSSLSPDSGVAGALYACGKIEKSRVKATQKHLVKGDLLFAWITWTGSSVAMCVFAALICCYQPACTSSGIPGLIAYLNGVKPLGGKSHFTGTRFLLLLFLIVGHSFLFFQFVHRFLFFFVWICLFFGGMMLLPQEK